MRAHMDRRTFLAGIAALARAAWLPRQSAAQSTKTRLILLGTGGGPKAQTPLHSSSETLSRLDVSPFGRGPVNGLR